VAGGNLTLRQARGGRTPPGPAPVAGASLARVRRVPGPPRATLGHAPGAGPAGSIGPVPEG
jgi:hypothetical protein